MSRISHEDSLNKTGSKAPVWFWQTKISAALAMSFKRFMMDRETKINHLLSSDGRGGGKKEITIMNRHHVAILKMTLATLSLVVVGIVASHGQGTAPDLGNLVAMEKKSIDAEMAKSSFSKKGQNRVRMAAFMIAVYAQNAKNDAAAMATLRDQALKVMKAAAAGKADEVKASAAQLSLAIQADPAAKTGPVALEKHLDLELLMRVFSSQKSGGFDLEKIVEDLVDAKSLDAGQLEKAALAGQKIQLLAAVVPQYAPASDKGKRTKKDWNDITAEMQKEAGALAAAAMAGKAGEIGKAAKRLSVTCTKCHDIFR
jgi:hypothetical protein